jgi:plastocyanin
MNRKRRVVVTVAVAAAVAGALFVPRATHGAAAATATSKNFGISIVGMGGGCTALYCYTPANVTIRQANTVTWTNNSIAPHTVTICTATACSGTGPGTGKDPVFNSGTINAGSTFVHQFTGKGTYNYYCMFHGFTVMHGTITVRPFAVTTTTLPAGSVGTAYAAKLKAAGGETPLHWTVVSGKLPAGLRLATGGRISGTPTATGTASFTVQAADSSGTALIAKKALSITIS